MTKETSTASPVSCRRWWRRCLVGLGVLLVALGAAVVGGQAELYGGLPQLSGEIPVPGVRSVVTIERDSLGVPTVTAADRIDLAYGLGFAHAQDRFFQMDLLRRSAAGELAELFGELALTRDKSARLHRFRARAQHRWKTLEAHARQLLTAYAAGVNAGLVGGLRRAGAWPFEYLLLRTAPRPWLPEDSLLCVLAMYLALQDNFFQIEEHCGDLALALPPPVVRFLLQPGSPWDAPLDGSRLPEVPLPGPDVVDLRQLPPDGPPPPRPRGRGLRGSNSWAVAGSRTAHGGALLANDMHLGLSLPNTWYRARLAWRDPQGQARAATGVTLPGTPALVVGSNGRLAWGFTNSGIDSVDFVVLEPLPHLPGYVSFMGRPEPLRRYDECIVIRGQEPVTFPVFESPYGPIWGNDARGKKLALRWVAHDEEGLNLLGAEFMTLDHLEDALGLAQLCGQPHQNFVAVDRHGRVAWTILGRVPRRKGFDGRLPTAWVPGQIGWDDYHVPGSVPYLLAPALGQLWTANNRTVGGEDLALLGVGGYDLGARASQIRDRLAQLERATEADMLALQLDDTARFWEPWRQLLLETLTPPACAAQPGRAELRRLVAEWSGQAKADAPGFRLVDAFLKQVEQRVFAALTKPVLPNQRRPTLYGLPHASGLVWPMVQARPMHWLDTRYASWEALLLDAIDAVLESFGKVHPLSSVPPGGYQSYRINHPLGSLPVIGPWLNLPPHPADGAPHHLPRIASPGFGASERLAVSPGREEQGYFHMPGGQCGHPCSPHYADGHAAWLTGTPTPFLPGPTVHTLRLLPGQ